MSEIRISGLDGLRKGAAEFIERLQPDRVYALYGPMGAGKTTLVSEICRQLGVEDEVSSPTFSIINIYDTDRGKRIYHFDCYRLESPEEAFEVGAEDYLESGELCFVEWPERIEALLPDDAVRVEISVEDNGDRVIRWV